MSPNAWRAVVAVGALIAVGLVWLLAGGSSVGPAGWPLLGAVFLLGASLAFVAAALAEGARGAREREEDIRRLQADLAEARAREDALRQEAEREREAARLKDVFLATVAHELRTPLSAMLGWAHVLRDEKVDEVTFSRAIEAILRNARAQTRLISDLMDLSRIVAGTMKLDLQAVEPVAVIRAAIETVRPAAEARRITLTANVEAEAGPMMADPGRLQQVLWNLLSNAIKFTPEGGTVAVRGQAEGGQIVITVEDTGPGIPPAFLPHVFERFRQASDAATRKGGLGLGLAIARAVVELHEGEITAANHEPGPGAVFTVRLPVKALRPAEARPPASAGAAWQVESGGALPSLDGVLALVLDTDEVREMVGTVLQGHGARVVALASAEDVLTILSGQRPDVLLLDLELADAGEGSLIRRIRALPAAEGGATPAAALAAFGSGDRTRALLAGFQLQLGKPVRPAELVAAVASLAGRTRPHQSSPAVEAAPTPQG